MKKAIMIIIVVLAVLSGCMSEEEKIAKANDKLGTKDKPIQMSFVPSKEAGKVIKSGKEIADFLHKETGYFFDVAVPTSYAAVIEAMGNYESDIAWLSTFAYLLASEKYGAQVKFMTVRNGLTEYRGQFVVRADSPINRLEDIEGRVIAYTDAASTAGYIFPSSLLKQKGIKPEKQFLAGAHSSAILALLTNKADVACSYWSPPDSLGTPQDARQELLETYPDVMEKTRIIGFTDWITNDTVTFRKNLPPEVEERLVRAFEKLTLEPGGLAMLKDLYSIDGLKPAQDSDYDRVRDKVESYRINAGKVIK